MKRALSQCNIINARLGTKMEQIQDITKMVNSCAEIADACLAGKINKKLGGI